MNAEGNYVHENYSNWALSELECWYKARCSYTLHEHKKLCLTFNSLNSQQWICLSFHHFHSSLLLVILEHAALCNDDANGNVPLGKSCNRYWSCQGGYPRLQRCPAQLVFDKHSLRCVVPPTEECDIPATPATPIDEQPNGVSEQRGQVSWKIKSWHLLLKR